MRILSWNLNGIRACTKRGFAGFLDRCGADVLGVQEVRALPDQIPAEARAPAGWHVVFSPAERLGYSGVGLYARIEPERVETSLGEPRFDVEGRFVAAHFRTGGGGGACGADDGRFAVVNCYFPKGSGKDRDNSRVPYKLDFYGAVFERAQRLRRQCPVLVIGDYNTAHRAIDLARPKANVRNSGFLPEERAEIDRWLEAGWVDTFRTLHPEEPDHYTWWAQRGGARARNVGWRIDYVLASPEAMEGVRDAFIWPDEYGSDHCPVGVDIDLQTGRPDRPPAQAQAQARRGPGDGLHDGRRLRGASARRQSARGGARLRPPRHRDDAGRRLRDGLLHDDVRHRRAGRGGEGAHLHPGEPYRELPFAGHPALGTAWVLGSTATGVRTRRTSRRGASG